MMNDGLKDFYRKKIIEILSINPRVERIVLYGSRAMGTYETTSDVDLALYGAELTLDDLAELSEKIDDLSMPQRIEIVLMNRIENQKLISQIRKHGIEWLNRSSQEDKTFVMIGNNLEKR
ncbi:MAG: nucleotidyltransferase domain-containing protein [Candidatus Omnitrophota bacterium]|jgi:predicted nucleotidyltransferase|nr:MAG: nucleotidyltransferase domain-containing protein [Candidatus Omnitrophota bacterium]